MNSSEIAHVVRCYLDGYTVKRVNKETYEEDILGSFEVDWDFHKYNYYALDNEFISKMNECMEKFDYEKALDIIYGEVEEYEKYELIEKLKEESRELLKESFCYKYKCYPRIVLATDNFVCVKKDGKLRLTLNMNCDIVEHEEEIIPPTDDSFDDTDNNNIVDDENTDEVVDNESESDIIVEDENLDGEIENGESNS